MSKGDNRRPTQVSDAQFASEWCETFGHKMRPEAEHCISCGKSAEEIEVQRG